MEFYVGDVPAHDQNVHLHKCLTAGHVNASVQATSDSTPKPASVNVHTQYLHVRRHNFSTDSTADVSAFTETILLIMDGFTHTVTIELNSCTYCLSVKDSKITSYYSQN